MKSIGKQIRQRRAALGLTQLHLARRSGQSRNWISIIESKGFHNPSVGSLEAIADALDCDLVVKLKPRSSTMTLTGEHDVEVKSTPVGGDVSISYIVAPDDAQFVGVDYAAGVDHTESIDVIRQDDGTLTVANA